MLLASGKAACKLVLICGLISWMTATERLPAETPVVLSKLAFNLVLPAFLCSKVATTMASPTATLSLAVLPLLAIVQVAAGALLGSVCANVVCQMNRSMASGTQGYVQPADRPNSPLELARHHADDSCRADEYLVRSTHAHPSTHTCSQVASYAACGIGRVAGGGHRHRRGAACIRLLQGAHPQGGQGNAIRHVLAVSDAPGRGATSLSARSESHLGGAPRRRRRRRSQSSAW